MVVSMERWKGKVAIVTGASSGIGAATARALVELGVIVVGLARRKDRMDALAKSLEGKCGKMYSVKTDITKTNEIKDAFKWIKRHLGPIHILINNAGISRNTTLVDGNEQMWKDTLDTNVLGLCVMTREAFKDMKAHNIAGHIIHINSMGGHRVPDIPNGNVYPASKFAVTALTETLRQELNTVGSKTKITSISPGGVKTEFLEASGLLTSEAMEDLFKSSPMLDASDVADAIVYVLSTPPHVQVHELMIKTVGEHF